MMLPYNRFCNATFRFTARFDVKFEKPESRKYTGITCKVN